MTARLSLVVAVAKNGVIGTKNDLPWRISDDLKWFKSVTLGKPVVMGRKTFESIGKPLPGRDNIVITRSHAFRAEGVFITRRVESAVKLAQACAREAGAEEICIIGGADIFAQTLPRADRIYLSRVLAEVEGDVVFPAIDSAEWTETKTGACPKNDRNEHACEFFMLDRKAGKRAKEG